MPQRYERRRQHDRHGALAKRVRGRLLVVGAIRVFSAVVRVFASTAEVLATGGCERILGEPNGLRGRARSTHKAAAS